MGKRPLQASLPRGPQANNRSLQLINCPSPPSCPLATSKNCLPARLPASISTMPMAHVCPRPCPPTIPAHTRHASASTLDSRPFRRQPAAFATLPAPRTPAACHPSPAGTTACVTSRKEQRPRRLPPQQARRPTQSPFNHMRPAAIGKLSPSFYLLCDYCTNSRFSRISNHWQWVIFIVVLVVGIAGIWIGACIWRRRYIRKRDLRKQAGITDSWGSGAPATDGAAGGIPMTTSATPALPTFTSTSEKRNTTTKLWPFSSNRS